MIFNLKICTNERIKLFSIDIYWFHFIDQRIFYNSSDIFYMYWPTKNQ
jgi:hypothetical protein